MSRELEDRGVARVTFRVRCETLGYGESVFLYPEATNRRAIPLYTTAANYPWYSAKSPTGIRLPVEKDDDGYNHHEANTHVYAYRYAIYRAGIFHRWERPSDGPSEIGSKVQDGMEGDDGDLNTPSTHSLAEGTDDKHHSVPLRLLAHQELYTVNDVLGITQGHPDIDHIRVRPTSGVAELTKLHSQRTMSSGSSLRALGDMKKSETSTKKVGFAPPPPSYSAQPSSNPHKRPKLRKPPVRLEETDGLIVTSVFLPVHLHRDAKGQWSADWDYEALLSMQTHLRVTRVGVVKWRGWHGNVGPDGSPQSGVPVEERHLVEACLRPFHCIPVWVDNIKFGQMYNGFCKGVLWPVLHNVTSVYSPHSYDEGKSNAEHISYSSRPSANLNSSNPHHQDVSQTLSSVSNAVSEYSMDDVSMGNIHGDSGPETDLWNVYTDINRNFVETIVSCFNEGDLIWIHGFHLMILPSMIVRRLPMAKIGYFIHTPFPSSEIFRTLWCREALLRGMLNADQIGFHLYEYARHFLTCCRRLLGLKYGMVPDESGGQNLAIEMNGRQVAITSIHAGIEPPILNQVLGHHGTKEKAASIRNQFYGKVIFSAIDRMESLKGIPLKLLGLERFLKRCPEWVGKIVLIQVGISAFERGDDYIRTKNDVQAMVTNLNKMYPGTVEFKEFSESEMRLPQRMALLRASDVVLVTPIRDGLNLIPLEFTVAHQDALDIGRNDGRNRGICILSEFSSTTRVMRGALHVNPWKISELANSFYQALTMSEDERLRRLRTATEFVSKVTTQRWAAAVLYDLKSVHKNADVGKYSGAGLGLGFRIVGMDSGFNSLDVSAVGKAYRNSRARLILMDYGGTILSNDNLDSLSRFQVATKTRAYTVPTPQMIQTLKGLCADKRNLVFIVSGKERHSLTSTLNDIPNLGLAAEHGMFISWPNSSDGKKKRMWEKLVPDHDTTWRSIVVAIMEVYTSRTHGSYIEETEMKVLWQYRDADPEFGYLQAKELEDHLSNVLREYAVDVLHGGVEEGGYVEVRPKGVNKGVVATYILKNVPKISTWQQKIDFTLVLGDDHCDEPMLSVMRQVGRRAIDSQRARKSLQPLPQMPASVTIVDVAPYDAYVSSSLQTYTCTVGKKPSAAANYLHDVNEVQEFLDSLVKIATRQHKFFSYVDLSSLNDGGSDGYSIGAEFQMAKNAQFSTGDMQNLIMNSQTISAGVTRSKSFGNFPSLPTSSKIDSKKKGPQKSVNTFLEGLGTIDDDDEEEAFFF